jgi:hypothetical protein
MKTSIRSVLVLLIVLASAASADEATHKNLGLGFHHAPVPTANSSGINTAAPIGARYWIGAAQKVAVDFGFGVRVHKDIPHDANLTGWSIDAGVPILLTSWTRVHFLFRPGLNYSSEQAFENPPPSTTKIDDALLTVTAELEAEIFLLENVSLSASHGFGITNFNPGAAGADSSTDFATLGFNFTDLGFRVYLW